VAVRVDEARNDDAVGGVDDAIHPARGAGEPAYGLDPAVFDQDVGSRPRAGLGTRDHEAAMNEDARSHDQSATRATGRHHPPLARWTLTGKQATVKPVAAGMAPKFAIFSMWQYSRSRPA